MSSSSSSSPITIIIQYIQVCSAKHPDAYIRVWDMQFFTNLSLFYKSNTQAAVICGSDTFMAQPSVTWACSCKGAILYKVSGTCRAACNWGVRPIISLWPPHRCAAANTGTWPDQGGPPPCMSHTSVYTLNRGIGGKGEKAAEENLKDKKNIASCSLCRQIPITRNSTRTEQSGIWGSNKYMSV